MASSKQHGIVIIGAGPAGLATAIAARNSGFGVLVVDHAVPPIDKACGEGIMPDGIAALSRLGVRIPPELGFAFRGIRFLEGRNRVEAVFPNGVGYSLRRTALHKLFVDHATRCGVQFRWGSRVSDIDERSLRINDERIPYRWLVGADGHNSTVRRALHIGRVRREQRRFGFRQHFAVKPWTDFVEVYWSNVGQAYVTPVAEDEVCVALITSDPHARLDVLATAFPRLAERLGYAVATSRAQGSITATRDLDSVSVRNAALVGEASGSVDAITGEGMSLGFQQAQALVNAIQSGSLASYDHEHRRIGGNPRRMAQFMRLMGDRAWLRQRALRALSAKPELFAQMLSVHIGDTPIHQFALRRSWALGWSMLTTWEGA